MIRIVVSLLFLGVCSLSFAQEEWWKVLKDSSDTVIPSSQVSKSETTISSVVQIATEDEPTTFQKGSVSIRKSPLVDKLVEFKATTIPPNTAPTKAGYRIQVFFDQDRSAVNNARKTLVAVNPDLPTYIKYDAPNYFLLGGDFRTQLNAEKARASLIGEFPTAIIVEDQIHFPKVK